MDNPVPATDKVADAKKKAQAQVKAQERRTLVVWLLIGVVVAGLFAALVAYIVRQDDVAKTDLDGSAVPAIATADGGFPVGKTGVVGQELDETRVRVDVYLDFMCPICAQFEEFRGGELDTLREAGTADVYYHPIAILDRFSSGTEYSTRSASAAALVAQEAPEQFMDFAEALFKNQPAEGSTGLTDEQLQGIATGVGVPEDVVAKIPDHAYKTWVRAATERASIDGVGGTPTLSVNGTIQDPQNNEDDLNWGTEGGITSYVNNVAGK